MIRKCLLTASLLSIALPAAAQQAPRAEDAADANGNDDIIVTAQPIDTIEGGQVSRGATLGVFGDRDLFETPISTKSFTEAYIVDRGFLNSNEIASQDASFSTTNAASINGATAGRLRGFRIEPFESTLDGLATVSGRRYALEFVDRVDILKGPSAAFTGLVGGVGGTINYISKKPVDADLTRITGLASGIAQFGGMADVSRRFGRDDAYGLRVNLSYRDGETSIEDIDERNSVIHAAFNARWGAASLDLQYGSLYSRTSGGSGGYFYPTGVPIGRAPQADEVSGPAWDSREMHDQFVRAQLNVEFTPRWSLFAAGALSRTQERFVGLGVTVIDANGTGEGFAFAQEGEVDWGDGYSIDLGLRGQVETGPVRHSLTLIGSYLRSKPAYSDLSIDPGYVQPPFDIFDPASQEGPTPTLVGTGTFYRLWDSTTQGFVIADEMALFDERLLITAALRYTDIGMDNFNYGAPSPNGPVSSYASDDWSPALAVLFRVTPAISVYANYMNAVEMGATAPVQAVNRGEVLPPDVSRQYEIGAKASFGSFAATVALFDIERPSAYIDADTLIFDTYGRQRHRGFEADLFGTIAPGVRLLASFTYLDAKLLRNANPALNGNRPVSVPGHVLVVGGDTDMPGIDGLTVSANLRWSGDQVYDVTNVRRIGSYVVADAGVRYRFTAGDTPLTVRLNVSNLFDRSYFQSTDFSAQTGAPRTVRFTLSADF